MGGDRTTINFWLIIGVKMKVWLQGLV